MSGANAVIVTEPKPVLPKTLLSIWYNTAEVPAMARALLIRTSCRAVANIRLTTALLAALSVKPVAPEPAVPRRLRYGRCGSGFHPVRTGANGGWARYPLLLPNRI